MNSTRNQSPRANIKPLLAIGLALFCASTSCLAGAGGGGGAIASIVKGATIVEATVIAIALLVLTTAWGVAGFKVAFQGAAFRDVASLIVGGAMGGGCAAIAAMFI